MLSISISFILKGKGKNMSESFKDIRPVIEPLIQYYKLPFLDQVKKCITNFEIPSVMKCIEKSNYKFRQDSQGERTLQIIRIMEQQTEGTILREVLDNYRNIRKISIIKSKINGQLFVKLGSSLRSIKKISLIRCGLGNRSAYILSKGHISNLKSLTISQDFLSNIGIKMLVMLRVPFLNVLTLFWTSVTVDSLRTLLKGFFSISSFNINLREQQNSRNAILKVFPRLANLTDKFYSIYFYMDHSKSLEVDFYTYLAKLKTNNKRLTTMVIAHINLSDDEIRNKTQTKTWRMIIQSYDIMIQGTQY